MSPGRIDRHLRAIKNLPAGFSLDSRGDRWRIRFRKKGQPGEHCSFKRIDDALDYARKLAVPEAKPKIKVDDDTTLVEACDVYESVHLQQQQRTASSTAAEREAIASVRNSPLAHRRMNSLSREDLLEWAALLRVRGRSVSTIRSRLAALIRIVRKVSGNCSLHLDARLACRFASPAEPVALPPTWYDQLLRGATLLGRNHQILFLLVADSGLWRSEVARLDGGCARRKRVAVPYVEVPNVTGKRAKKAQTRIQISAACAEAIGDRYSVSDPICFSPAHRIDAAWKAINVAAGTSIRLRDVQRACRSKRVHITDA